MMIFVKAKRELLCGKQGIQCFSKKEVGRYPFERKCVDVFSRFSFRCDYNIIIFANNTGSTLSNH